MAIAGAGRVTAADRLIIVEGNYLLLDETPWRALADLWDLSIILSEPRAVLRQRLQARWAGKATDQIAAHLANDLANAETVMTRSLPADIRLSLTSPAGTP